MRKIALTLTAASALALGACQSKEADKVEDQAEAQADAIDAQADSMSANNPSTSRSAAASCAALACTKRRCA